MQFVVAHAPYGILLLTERGKPRLPLVKDGIGEDEATQIENLLSFHALAAVMTPELLGDPGLQVFLVEVQLIGGDSENTWLVTGGDPVDALRTFGKYCPSEAERRYLRVASLLEEHLRKPLAA